jgi:hypothetical protein
MQRECAQTVAVGVMAQDARSATLLDDQTGSRRPTTSAISWNTADLAAPKKVVASLQYCT